MPIRHSRAGENPDSRSCYIVLDTRLRGYDVSQIDDVRDDAEE